MNYKFVGERGERGGANCIRLRFRRRRDPTQFRRQLSFDSGRTRSEFDSVFGHKDKLKTNGSLRYLKPEIRETNCCFRTRFPCSLVAYRWRGAAPTRRADNRCCYCCCKGWCWGCPCRRSSDAGGHSQPPFHWMTQKLWGDGNEILKFGNLVTRNCRTNTFGGQLTVINFFINNFSQLPSQLQKGVLSQLLVFFNECQF